MKVFVFIVAALKFGLVLCYSFGPPAQQSTCENLMPASPAPHVRQTGSGTYVITANIPASSSADFLAYTGGTQYTGTISADVGNNIRGFLIQAVDPSGDRIGSFTTGSGQRFLDCSSINSVPASATLVHNTPNTASTVSFTWTAPTGSNGMVRFRFTIVRNRFEYFGPLSSASSSLPPVTTMSSTTNVMTSDASSMSATTDSMSSTMPSTTSSRMTTMPSTTSSRMTTMPSTTRSMMTTANSANPETSSTSNEDTSSEANTADTSRSDMTTADASTITTSLVLVTIVAVFSSLFL